MSAASSSSHPRIFVSHSHHDNALGLRLVADLRARLGEDAVWYDASGGLRGGDEWWKKIVAEITARDTFIVILSPDALASDWVPREMDMAYMQHVKQGKHLLPLSYRPCNLRADWQLIQSLPITDPATNPAAYARQLATILTEIIPNVDMPQLSPTHQMPPNKATPGTLAAKPPVFRLPETRTPESLSTLASPPPDRAAPVYTSASEQYQAPQQLSQLSSPSRTATVSAPPASPGRVQPTPPPSRQARLSRHSPRSPFIVVTAVLLVFSLLGGLLLYEHFQGGASVSSKWSEYSSPTTDVLTSVAMVSASDGWAVGGAYDYGTSNSSGPAKDFFTIGILLHYSKGQWQTMNSPTTGGLYGISMVSATEGWAVGWHGILLHYSNGQWSKFSSPTTNNLYGVAMVSATEGWAVGDNATILHYSGGHWSKMSNLPPPEFPGSNTYDLSGVTMVSATEGWAVGDEGTILHYSGGQWNSSYSPKADDYTSVAMASPTDGWVVGFDISGGSGTAILHYKDGRWSEVNSPATTKGPYSISMVSSTDGWYVGQNGTILHYSDGQWGVVDSPSTEVLFSVSMVSATEGWAVGDNGTILHYSAGQ